VAKPLSQEEENQNVVKELLGIERDRYTFTKKMEYDDCQRSYSSIDTKILNELGKEEEIYFGFYHKDGSTVGELRVRWYKIGNEGQLAPKLEVFNDAFKVLLMMPDLLEWFGKKDSINFTPAEFMEALKKLGFKVRK
jgi:hypothetical protein